MIFYKHILFALVKHGKGENVVAVIFLAALFSNENAVIVPQM